jgi:hypothetical protein
MNPAIREARRRSRSATPTSEPGFCKREVREVLSLAVGRVIPSRSGDAADCWANARHKHHTDDPESIPRGVPVFWLGGSQGHGHVSLSTGNAGHWSTDLLRPGWFDRTGIRLVARKWGLRLVGWTEDYDAVTVYRDGHPVIARSLARTLLGEPVPLDFAAVVDEVPEVRGETFGWDVPDE